MSLLLCDLTGTSRILRGQRLPEHSGVNKPSYMNGCRYFFATNRRTLILWICRNYLVIELYAVYSFRPIVNRIWAYESPIGWRRHQNRWTVSKWIVCMGFSESVASGRAKCWVSHVRRPASSLRALDVGMRCSTCRTFNAHFLCSSILNTLINGTESVSQNGFMAVFFNCR